ncbi:MAG: CvpA family protein [Clostridia bacterium]|nr:CvpA family protein [Clostridia bacterium]
MSYILDLGVILVLVLMMFIGYKRGMFKALSRLLGIGLVLLLAVTLSGPLAEWAFDSFVAEDVTESVAADLSDDDSEEDVRSGISSVLEELPGPMVNMMVSNGVGTVDQIADKLEDEKEATTLTAAEVMTEKIIRPIGVTLLRALFFLIMMTIGFILVMIVLKLLNSVITHLPIISGLNKWLGLVFGALEGVVLVLVLVALVQTSVAAGDSSAMITQADLEHTILTGAIAQINPLYGLFTI